MRRLIAVALVAALLLAVGAPAAHAGGAAVSVALGLASFAVFNQFLFAAYAYPRYYGYAPYDYPYPYVTYSSPPVLAQAPAAPAVQRVVEYPHGRYELLGDGITTAYQWVWIPRVPPVPPPPPAQQ